MNRNFKTRDTEQRVGWKFHQLWYKFSTLRTLTKNMGTNNLKSKEICTGKVRLTRTIGWLHPSLYQIRLHSETNPEFELAIFWCHTLTNCTVQAPYPPAPLPSLPKTTLIWTLEKTPQILVQPIFKSTKIINKFFF